MLGIVPPARQLPPEQDETGSGPLKSEFRIVGYRDGWFLIDKIEAPGAESPTPYPRALPQPYQGRGWVSSRMVGAGYAHSGLPEGNLFLSPHADAASSEIVDKNGKPPGAGRISSQDLRLFRMVGTRSDN